VIQKYCLESSQANFSSHSRRQGHKRILLDDSRGLQQYGEPRYRVFLVDCMRNEVEDFVDHSGGTVFIYFCVNDDLTRKLSNRENEPVSFSVEIQCRGMVCRTESGILDHEKLNTKPERKKFEAAWRLFKKEFRVETKSRLLMVLVQSGQDFELGEVSCSRVAEKSVKSDGSTTLLEFFHGNTPLSSIPAQPSGLSSYSQCGIFTAVENRVKNKECYTYTEGVGTVGPSFIDDDLEAALAISHGDLELQRALALIDTDEVAAISQIKSEDLELQRALTLSMQACAGAPFYHDSPGWVISPRLAASQHEENLNDAIERSLQDQNIRVESVIDLVSDTEEASVIFPKRSGIETCSQHDVIDLRDDEIGDGPVTNNACLTKDITATVENMDNAQGHNVRHVTTEEKRRLTAQAAMKRISS